MDLDTFYEAVELAKEIIRRELKALLQPFQELAEIAREYDEAIEEAIKQGNFKRERQNTPYKPKWKPFTRDKRLTIKRCRSCCNDKIHKNNHKSSFDMPITIKGKRRYNKKYDNSISATVPKNRILLSRAYCIEVALTLHAIRPFS